MTAASNSSLDADTTDLATAHYALVREDERKATASVLVFRIGAEWLAISTALFDRVAEVPEVHSLPHRRGNMTVGLVTVGGDLVVHLSLANLLGIDAEGAAAPAEGRTRAAVPRLVVFADARGRLAITVNEVWGIFDHDAKQLQPIPSTLARALVSYTSAMLTVDGRHVGVLDGPRVLHALSSALT